MGRNTQLIYWDLNIHNACPSTPLMYQEGAQAVQYTAQLLGRIITLFITLAEEVMNPGGITGGNENRRLVFCSYHLWLLQVYGYLCKNQKCVPCIYVTEIHRITYVYMMCSSCYIWFWSCRYWDGRACILLLCCG